MEAKEGNFEPDVSSFAQFDDDRYLLPVMENDALLFSLDELDTPGGTIEENRSVREEIPASSEKIKQLEEKLEDVTQQFAGYRQIVQRTLGERLTDNDPAISTDKATNSNISESREDSYFESYSYNGRIWRLHLFWF
jgi:type I protein arginine methyltransferase